VNSGRWEMTTRRAKVIPFPTRPARTDDAAGDGRPSFYEGLPEEDKRELLLELASEFLRTNGDLSGDPDDPNRPRE
jgi:hypothetical protein